MMHQKGAAIGSIDGWETYNFEDRANTAYPNTATFLFLKKKPLKPHARDAIIHSPSNHHHNASQAPKRPHAPSSHPHRTGNLIGVYFCFSIYETENLLGAWEFPLLNHVHEEKEMGGGLGWLVPRQ